MTDNEILKALECCAYHDTCDGCPMRGSCVTPYEFYRLLYDLINRQKAELLQYAKDQHDLMIEKDELFDIAEKQKTEIEFLIRMKASDFETSYTAVKARLADEMNRAEMDRRKDTEIRQLRIKLDDCERDIIPKLKYSFERANKYGAETDAENIRLLKENEDLSSDLTSAKAEIERLKKENLELEIEKFKCNTKVGTLTGRITLMERDIPFIKAEAIKDFCEKRGIEYVENDI